MLEFESSSNVWNLKSSYANGISKAWKPMKFETFMKAFVLRSLDGLAFSKVWNLKTLERLETLKACMNMKCEAFGI